jgi:hypothetical protein
MRRCSAWQWIMGIQDFTTPSGDFKDRSEDKYVWEMTLSQVSPSAIPINSQTSGTSTVQASQLTSTNLDMLKVTVHPSASTQTQDQVSVTGLVYVPSDTSTTTPAAGGTG